MPGSDPSLDGHLSAEELTAQQRRVTEQAAECRHQARRFDDRMHETMASLAESWQGGRAVRVMSGLGLVHDTVMARFALNAKRLDEQSDRLRQAAAVAEEAERGLPAHSADSEPRHLNDGGNDR